MLQGDMAVEDEMERGARLQLAPCSGGLCPSPFREKNSTVIDRRYRRRDFSILFPPARTMMTLVRGGEHSFFEPVELSGHDLLGKAVTSGVSVFVKMTE